MKRLANPVVIVGLGLAATGLLVLVGQFASGAWLGVVGAVILLGCLIPLLYLDFAGEHEVDGKSLGRRVALFVPFLVVITLLGIAQAGAFGHWPRLVIGLAFLAAIIVGIVRFGGRVRSGWRREST